VDADEIVAAAGVSAMLPEIRVAQGLQALMPEGVAEAAATIPAARARGGGKEAARTGAS